LPIVLYDARCNSNCYNLVLNKFVYAGLDHLCLVGREINFSPTIMPELAISPHPAYELNPRLALKIAPCIWAQMCIVVALVMSELGRKFCTLLVDAMIAMQ